MDDPVLEHKHQIRSRSTYITKQAETTSKAYRNTPSSLQEVNLQSYLDNNLPSYQPITGEGLVAKPCTAEGSPRHTKYKNMMI